MNQQDFEKRVAAFRAKQQQLGCRTDFDPKALAEFRGRQVHRRAMAEQGGPAAVLKGLVQKFTTIYDVQATCPQCGGVWTAKSFHDRPMEKICPTCQPPEPAAPPTPKAELELRRPQRVFGYDD